MNWFSQSLVRPNMPLRKPSTSPARPLTAGASPRLPFLPTATPEPLSNDSGRPTGNARLVNKDTLLVPPAMSLNLCNYCSQQGNFRCTRCKKTFYCSVGCQREDWKAHRHVCKSSTPETSNEKPKENADSPVLGQRASLPEPKVHQSILSSGQKVYLVDLNKNKITKGAEIQVSVLELHSAGRFFVHPQCTEVAEALHAVSVELQRTYSGSSLPGTPHVPQQGEVCAVQFSLDKNWYRGVAQSIADDQKTANMLYIDFGNEENVSVDMIRPLASHILPIAPCAMECCVAGVVPVSGIWSVECGITLRQVLLGKSMAASVVDVLHNGRVFVVDMMLSSLGTQLSKFLIDHGYAAKEPVSPKPVDRDIKSLVSASLENFKRLSHGKDENTGVRSPEPLTQGLGDYFTAVVTLLRSPHDIICQKLENAYMIQEMQLRLRDYCAQMAASHNFRPAPGTVCCSQFTEDNMWYRAKVLAYSSEERVCVGYVDFGNSEEVELGRLRPLNDALLELPMQAIPCALAGIHPAGETWSEDCLLVLQQRVSNRVLRVEIVGERDGTALVAMIDETSDPQANVAELLLSAGYAVPDTNGLQGAEQAVQPAPAEPFASPCLVWSSVELPCDGQAVALLVSIVESPGKFYCYIYNSDDLQKLMTLVTELTQHCEADATPFTPKVGEPCCALFSGDAAWYRAMVQELCEDMASVYFVDYGNSTTVDRSQLRAITPQLLKLPFQAIRCWLTGVDPLGSEWSSESLLWFQSLVVGQKVLARVAAVTAQGYAVELESDGHSVGAALVLAHMAQAPGEAPQPLDAAAHTDAHAGAATTEPELKEVEPVSEVSDQTPDRDVHSVSVATPSEELFPVDWRMEELPLSQTFQPQIAAVSSPSLFFVVSPSQVDPEKLQQVMMEVAVYCSTNQPLCPPPSSAPPVQRKPAPGAACCALFSVDKNWYRAVVLEAAESEVSVLYADYGNTETVPYSSILPIPRHLLQLPFHVTRCALRTQQHFPSVWPQAALERFSSLLTAGVLATVQSFDGSTHLLTLCVSPEKGGGDLSAMVLDAPSVSMARSSVCSAAKSDAAVGPDRTDTAPAGQTSREPALTADDPVLVTDPVVTPIVTPGLKAADPVPVVTPGLTAADPVVTPGQRVFQEETTVSTLSLKGNVDQKADDQKEPAGLTNTESNGHHKSDCCCKGLNAKPWLCKLEYKVVQTTKHYPNLLGCELLREHHMLLKGEMDNLEQLLNLQLYLLEQIAGKK